jgi:hypothetical protein
MLQHVALSQPSAEKNTTYVNIVSYVRSLHVLDRYAEIAFKDFNGHSCFFLAYPLKAIEACLYFARGKLAAPDTAGISIVTVQDFFCGRDNPLRILLRKTVKSGRSNYCF